MTRSYRALIVLLACVLPGVGPSSQAQQPPRLLPFQGHLTAPDGKPVADGAKLIQFRIYDQPAAGGVAWVGEVHRTTVNGGLINLILGSKASLESVDFDRTLYLEITVDANDDNAITAADPPLLPRQVLLPVVFAREAAEARDSRNLAGHNWASLLDKNDPVTGRLSGTKLADDSLPATKVADGALPGSKLMQGTVPGSAIKDADVALAKLAKEVADRLVPTGTVMPWLGAGDAAVPVPEGWVLADGRTIGSAISGADVAAESTMALYILLWTSISNNELPIMNADGTSAIRGASGQVDFDAGKRLPLPDLRGRAVVGAGQASGLTQRGLASEFGSETHALTEQQIPPHHHHVFAEPSGSHERMSNANFPRRSSGNPALVYPEDPSGWYVYSVTGTAVTPTLGRSSTVGAGQPFALSQPSTALTYLIKI